MKHVLTLLIRHEIKQTRFVRTLECLDIDATSQLSNASDIIFELMGMSVALEDEYLLDSYFNKIESAVEDEKANEEQHVQNIANWLETVAKKE